MLYVVIGVIVVLAIIWIMQYNGFVKLKNWIEESWAQIDVQLKRRYDLIPNLIETTKGYAKYEQETFQKIVDARTALVTGGLSREEIMEKNNELTGMLKSVFAIGEAYPDLKASQNFKVLQEELISTENKISYARQLYNKTVAQYNIKIAAFPGNIFSGIHGFKRQTLLETKNEERDPIKVSF